MKLDIVKDYKNIYYYFQGNIRLFLWKYFPMFIRKHIEEQFIYRSRVARDCTENTSCYGCGCLTPELYFASKECSLEKLPIELREELVGRETKCYPKLMDKVEWLRFKVQNDITNIIL